MCNLYVSGRQALLDLALSRGWKRLWVPSYFCEETLNCIQRAGIELRHYNIIPSDDPIRIIPSVPAAQNEGLLVVNYFGLFNRRSFSKIDCEIVEDHTHNLIGPWATNSNADWCIASLRKTLPIADGGILWSPKHHKLPEKPMSVALTENLMAKRVHAMDLKRDYLKGKDIAKGEYLKIFKETENAFDSIPISGISGASSQVLKNLDIRAWYDAKYRNWSYLHKCLKGIKSLNILTPENRASCPFSLTLRFVNKEMRDAVRMSLIANQIYPAILWIIENDDDKAAQSFGDSMLSVHCDGRYSLNDMEILVSIIKDLLN